MKDCEGKMEKILQEYIATLPQKEIINQDNIFIEKKKNVQERTK
jgi:hypothetical protein